MIVNQNEIVRSERLAFIDNVIADLPEEERCSENPRKTCRSCYNLGATLIPLGMYWARSRCRYCEDYSNWNHILNLRKEIEQSHIDY